MLMTHDVDTAKRLEYALNYLSDCSHCPKYIIALHKIFQDGKQDLGTTDTDRKLLAGQDRVVAFLENFDQVVEMFFARYGPPGSISYKPNDRPVVYEDFEQQQIPFAILRRKKILRSLPESASDRKPPPYNAHWQQLFIESYKRPAMNDRDLEICFNVFGLGYNKSDFIHPEHIKTIRSHNSGDIPRRHFIAAGSFLLTGMAAGIGWAKASRDHSKIQDKPNNLQQLECEVQKRYEQAAKDYKQLWEEENNHSRLEEYHKARDELLHLLESVRLERENSGQLPWSQQQEQNRKLGIQSSVSSIAGNTFGSLSLGSLIATGILVFQDRYEKNRYASTQKIDGTPEDVRTFNHRLADLGVRLGSMHSIPDSENGPVFSEMQSVDKLIGEILKFYTKKQLLHGDHGPQV